MMPSSNELSGKCFVCQLETSLASKIQNDLVEMQFQVSKPPYTFFSAKKKGVCVIFYQSGKMTVQGQGMREFIEFYLEPNLLKNFSFTNPHLHFDKTPRIGVDESGKGDFFGPLCIAGFFAESKEFDDLLKIGVKDSKTLNDSTIEKIAKKLKEHFQYHVIVISPKRYNEMYQSFQNLNRLLAWGHAHIIEVMTKKTGCKNVIIDQFAHEGVVLSALKKKNITLPIIQKHKAEEDIIVAAASILARNAFVENLDFLSQKLNVKLPKGGGKNTVEMGKTLILNHGLEILDEIAKIHFKNYQDIIHK
jgi:ribonuclease HIII